MSYDREICETPGCTNLQVVITHNYCKTGMSYYRSWCSACHNAKTGALHGVASIPHITAMRAGFDDINDHKNSTHPSRKYRKSYCENKDGRLGITCDCTIHISAQLHVDHIDGNPTNNDPENLQTLCANCHLYKTHANKDYLTPGRKALKQRQANANNNIFSALFDWS